MMINEKILSHRILSNKIEKVSLHIYDLICRITSHRILLALHKSVERPGLPFRPNLLNEYLKKFASKINLLVLLNNNTNKVNEYILLSGHQGSLKVPM